MPLLTRRRPTPTELVEKVERNYDIYSAEEAIARLEKELYEKSNAGKNWAECTECKRDIEALLSLFDLIKSHGDSLKYADSLISPFRSKMISKLLYPNLDEYLGKLKTITLVFNNPIFNNEHVPTFPLLFIVLDPEKASENKEAADKTIDYMKFALREHLIAS